jgi:hypothetical protein
MNNTVNPITLWNTLGGYNSSAKFLYIIKALYDNINDIIKMEHKTEHGTPLIFKRWLEQGCGPPSLFFSLYINAMLEG